MRTRQIWPWMQSSSNLSSKARATNSENSSKNDRSPLEQRSSGLRDENMLSSYPWHSDRAGFLVTSGLDGFVGSRCGLDTPQQRDRVYGS